MTLGTAIIVILAATLFSALYSGLETGVYVWDRIDASNPSRLSRLLKRREMLVITCLIGTNLSVSIATRAFGDVLTGYGLDASAQHTAEMLLLTPWLFILGEIIPKGLYQAHAPTFLPKTIWLLVISRVVFAPAIWILRLVTRGLLALMRGTPQKPANDVTRRRLAWLLQDHEGGLSREQTRMAGNVLSLKERHVTAVMEPCRRVSRIDVNSSLAEVQQRFLTSNFSFFVVTDRRPENVVGIVYLNQVLLSEKNMSLRELIVEIPEISHKSTLTGALTVLREHSVPVARVTGSKGGVMGLLFTRRVVQQIVGELQIW